jgi:hypothetical protein
MDEDGLLLEDAEPIEALIERCACIAERNGQIARQNNGSWEKRGAVRKVV